MADKRPKLQGPINWTLATAERDIERLLYAIKDGDKEGATNLAKKARHRVRQALDVLGWPEVAGSM